MQSSVQRRSSYQTFPSQVEIINSKAGQVRLERAVCIFIQLKTRAAYESSNALQMVPLTLVSYRTLPSLHPGYMIRWSLTRPPIYLRRLRGRIDSIQESVRDLPCRIIICMSWCTACNPHFSLIQKLLTKKNIRYVSRRKQCFGCHTKMIFFPDLLSTFNRHRDRDSIQNKHQPVPWL